MLTKDVLLSSHQADYVLSIGQFLCFVYLPLFDLFNFFYYRLTTTSENCHLDHYIQKFDAQRIH